VEEGDGETRSSVVCRMSRLRISAWLALAVAILQTGVLIVGEIHIRALGGPFDPISDVFPTLTFALLLWGAIAALRVHDGRILIAAWAWLAGMHTPYLLRHESVPDYVRQVHDPNLHALLVHGWRFSQNYVFGVDAVYSFVAIAGLWLALSRRTTAIGEPPSSR
jgi:hypothetical protein